jgi:hypothetical protein
VRAEDERAVNIDFDSSSRCDVDAPSVKLTKKHRDFDSLVTLAITKSLRVARWSRAKISFKTKQGYRTCLRRSMLN